MIIQQEKDPVTIQSLMAKNAFLESRLAETKSVISEHDTTKWNLKIFLVMRIIALNTFLR